MTVILLLSGCAAIEIKKGAEKIIVSRIAAPRGCKFIGTVVGEQGGSLSGGWTSNKNLALGAMNDIKNKTYDLGANYVVLETNQAGNTISGSFLSYQGTQTDVTNIGNAYQCPPKEIGIEE